MNQELFTNILEFLHKVPAIGESIGTGMENGLWWIKFHIDIKNKLAWNVVQEFGYVLNYLSIEERLPTLFKPVSPPPYLNGGPEHFLSWVIATEISDFSPDDALKWLKGRLPDPVDQIEQWEEKE